MKNTSFSPQTHIFLWDLHEVILEKNRRNWVTLCIQFNRKWELIRKLNTKSIKIFLTFALERMKIIKKQMVSEELIEAARTNNNEALIELITAVCSAYRPISGTIQIMNELSALGYKHHLGSNIGKTVFDNCLIKYPQIFTMFESYAIPFNKTETDIIKKPHPEFFLAHIQKHNLPAENFIFIDDRPANILAAQSVGMHAIQFKNAEQLRKKLAKHLII